MQDQPLHSQIAIDKANCFVDHLNVSVKFIEACFNFLPYQKLDPLLFSLTYSYSDDRNFHSVDQIIAELKRCITYQVNNEREISIPAEIKISQKAVVEGQEVDLFYYGALHILDIAGWVSYCWYQSTPEVHIELRQETAGITILSLFNNFQEAITDQINKKR